jgi:hypothetical protein
MTDDVKKGGNVSTAAKLAGAGKSGDQGKVAQAAQEDAKARVAQSTAAQKAAPTGKDIPEMAAENIKGVNTANNPDQPRELKARGAQLEPALIGKDGGSLPHAHVPSPTGLIPASAVGDSATALARHAETLKEERLAKKLTEEQLRTMNKHEIRAVAHDRGFSVGQGGKNSVIRHFLAEQEK